MTGRRRAGQADVVVSGSPGPGGAPAARVGVISDTHVGEWIAALPADVARVFAGVDVILHAGDLTDLSVLEELGRIAPVVAVGGDHDARAGLAMPRTRVVDVAGYRFGVTHGRRGRWIEMAGGAVSVVLGRPCLMGFHRAIRRRFGDVDCIVYGHLHLPDLRVVEGAVLFSPGAVHNPENAVGFAAGGLAARLYLRFRRSLAPEVSAPAVGLVEVDAAGIRPRIVPLVP